MRRDGTPEEIARRLDMDRERAARLGGAYLEDMVLGANDGVITVFAVVAGAMGGALGAVVILILGFANLVADAFSMGASNLLGKLSCQDYTQRQREIEEWQVEHVPHLEREEIADIFRSAGLNEEQVNAAVGAITQSKTAWVDLMMSHELGLADTTGSAWKHGLATFIAFVVVGSFPLIPYMFCGGDACFAYSAVSAGVALFITGSLRTLFTGIGWFRGGLEMLAVGTAAGMVAYAIGRIISAIV